MNDRWVSEQLKNRNEIMSLSRNILCNKAGFSTEQNIMLHNLL